METFTGGYNSPVFGWVKRVQISNSGSGNDCSWQLQQKADILTILILGKIDNGTSNSFNGREKSLAVRFHSRPSMGIDG
jgi:hypothetical protein